MEILNQRINIKAVKAYQTVEMEMTISGATNEEVAQVKEYLMEEARSAVERLAKDIEGTTQAKQVTPFQNQRTSTPTQAPTVRVTSTPIQNQGFNQSRPQQYQSNESRPASQKQLDYLRNAFNYVPNGPITFDQANELLMQFKSQR